MGIDAETAKLLLDLIKADAASRPSGKVRTAAVVAAAEAKKLHINGAAIRMLAGFAGLALERGAEPGKGAGGRKVGAKDLNPRRRRGPDPDRPSRGDEVARLRAEHPEWTLEQIGEAVSGGMTKQGVAKHLAERSKPQ